MNIDLSGRRVLITAGAAGIGRVMAERFAAVGAGVTVCDVDEAALADIAAADPDILAHAADVADADQIDTLFDRIEQHWGGLDILVNNAGISGPTKPVEQITPQEWARTIAVNLNGHFHPVRRAVPLFKARQQGVILNMSSTAGRLGMPLRAPYSASKYAVRGFTDALAVELGAFNIRVNAILPGLVDGQRGRRVLAEQATAAGFSFENYLPQALHNISLHTMIDPGEIADMAVFLSSDFARHVSGQSIGVCGNFETYRGPLPGGSDR